MIGANTQAKATKDASKVQKQMYEQTRADLAPFRAAGQQGTNMLMAALPELTSQINLDRGWLEQTPGYQFAKAQGQKAVQNSAAARGLGTSGAALKGAANFATGLADQTYGDQFTREMQQREARYNRLMGTAQLGANAAAQTGNFGIQTAQNIGNNTIQGANAQAAGLTGAANALTNAYGQYQGYQLANQLMNGGGGYQNMWAKGTGLY